MAELTLGAPRRAPANADLDVPGDKSISHRALMCAAIADGTSTISGLNGGADVASTWAILSAIGVPMTRGEQGVVEVRGVDAFADPAHILDCGNSGSTMRMLAGLLAGRINAAFDGDASLRRRPMERVATPLRAMGADVQTNNGVAPLVLHRADAPLQGRRFALEIASAQLKSALLFAGLHADGVTSVVEPAQTRDHTERMLAAMGASIDCDGATIAVRRSRLRPLSDFTVPGDFSSAFFFIAAAAALPGARIRIRSVGVNPTRTAALDVLRSRGARVRLAGERMAGGEPVADVEVQCETPLRGVSVDEAVVANLIDEVPALCAVASVARGTTLIRGAAELRTKESDRIATTAALLRSFGATVDEYGDGLAVHGPRDDRIADRVLTQGDHRIGMSGALLALFAGSPIRIDDGAAIETSFPRFARIWNQTFLEG